MKRVIFYFFANGLMFLGSAGASIVAVEFILPRTNNISFYFVTFICSLLTISSVTHLYSALAGRSQQLDGIDAQRTWELLSYLFPRRIREQVYEPAHQELLKDYLLTRRRYRTKWAKRWLSFCFVFRTAILGLDCLCALLKDRVAQWTCSIDWLRELIDRIAR